MYTLPIYVFEIVHTTDEMYKRKKKIRIAKKVFDQN